MNGHPPDSPYSLQLKAAQGSLAQTTFERLRDLADEIEQQFNGLREAADRVSSLEGKLERMDALLAIIADAHDIDAVHAAIREDAAHAGTEG